MDSGLSLNSCACYHPPNLIYDVPSFKQHLAHSIRLLIDNDPNAIFILTGDLNGLNTSELQTDLGLVQIPTHTNNILDQFVTNRPDQFVVQVAQSLVKTKHKALIVNSRADCVKVVGRPQRTKVTVLDYTPLVSCLLRQALANYNWGGITAAITCHTDNIDNIYNDFVTIVK